MVAIDDESSGYRAIILPTVERHPSVLKAVLASSTYRIALRLSSSPRAFRRSPKSLEFDSHCLSSLLSPSTQWTQP